MTIKVVATPNGEIERPFWKWVCDLCDGEAQDEVRTRAEAAARGEDHLADEHPNWAVQSPG
jgi:hypothetical protein